MMLRSWTTLNPFVIPKYLMNTEIYTAKNCLLLYLFQPVAFLDYENVVNNNLSLDIYLCSPWLWDNFICN